MKTISTPWGEDVDFPDEMDDPSIANAIDAEMKRRVTPAVGNPYREAVGQTVRDVSTILASPITGLYNLGKRAVQSARGLDWGEAMTSPGQLASAAGATVKDLSGVIPEATGALVGGAAGTMVGGPAGGPGGALLGMTLARGGWEGLKKALGYSDKSVKDIATTTGETMLGGALGMGVPKVLGIGTHVADPARAAAFKSAGVSPSLGDLTGGWGAGQMESIASRSLFGKGRMQKFQQQQLEDLKSGFESTLEDLGGVKPSMQLGGEVEQAVKNRLNLNKKAYEAAKERITGLAGETPITTENRLATINRLIGEIDVASPAIRARLKEARNFLEALRSGPESPSSVSGFGKTHPSGVPAEGYLNPAIDMGEIGAAGYFPSRPNTVVPPSTNVSGSMGGYSSLRRQSPPAAGYIPEQPGQTYPGWKADNTFFGEQGRTNALVPDMGKGRYQALFSASMDDLAQSLPDLKPLVEKAKDYWKESVKAVDETTLGKLAAGKMPPEKVGSLLDRRMTEPMQDVRKWAPSLFEDIRNRGLLDKMETAGAVNLEQGWIDPARFSKVWNSMSNEVREYAFPNPTERGRLDSIAKVGEILGQKGLGPGKTPGQGSNLPLWQSAGVASAATRGRLAAIAPALSLIGIPEIMGKIATSPHYIRRATTPLTPTERAASMVGFGKLSNHNR